MESIPTQNCIAEKLEPLVAIRQAIGMKGSVTEGLQQEIAIAESVSDAALEHVEIGQQVVEDVVGVGDFGEQRRRDVHAEARRSFAGIRHLDPHPFHQLQGAADAVARQVGADERFDGVGDRFVGDVVPNARIGHLQLAVVAQDLFLLHRHYICHLSSYAQYFMTCLYNINIIY